MAFVSVPNATLGIRSHAINELSLKIVRISRRQPFSKPNIAINVRCGMTPGGPSDDDVNASANDGLLQDAQRFRASKKRREGSSPPEKKPLQSVIETILIWDFFAVCLLLAWLGVAVVLHYSSKNDVLLDPWLLIWPNVTQPLLGILMLAAISQGAFSYFSK